ncbi:MAG: hypothetical protein ACK561_06550 [Pseudomonadaceae bacterium]
MKSAIITLLKFNAKMGMLFFIFGLVFGKFIGHRPNALALAAVFAILATWIVGNIAIFLRRRRAIANSIKEGALDAAAAAIQFQESAKRRAQERMEEKGVDSERKA